MRTRPTAPGRRPTDRRTRQVGTAAALAFAVLTLVGCSKFEQIQYFEVVGPPDPITGLTSRSYYRMTVTGQGMGVEEYKMRAAYLSSAALDTLDGKIPTIPAADMDEDRRQYFRTIRTAYLRTAQARAEELAKRYADGAMDPQQFDQVMTEISRAVWAVTLSDSDLASLGQVRSVDPFEFRKLVFYASARAVALDRYNAQVDSAIQKTNALANLFDRSRVRRESTANEELLEKARAVHSLGERLRAAESDKGSTIERLAALDARISALTVQQQAVSGQLEALQARIPDEEQGQEGQAAEQPADAAEPAEALRWPLDVIANALLQAQEEQANPLLQTISGSIEPLTQVNGFLLAQIKQLNEDKLKLSNAINRLDARINDLTAALTSALNALNDAAGTTTSESEGTDDEDSSDQDEEETDEGKIETDPDGGADGGGAENPGGTTNPQ